LSADELSVTVYLPVYKLIELRSSITRPIIIQHPEGSIQGYIKQMKFKATLESRKRIPVRITLAKL